MNTPIDQNDPRLMDFVLGELDETEARELAQLLQARENAEARAEVDALRDVVRAANTALQAEAAGDGPALSPFSRSRILETARTRDGRHGMGRRPYRLFALAAMLLLCLGGVWFYRSFEPLDQELHLAAQYAEETEYDEIAALEKRLVEELDEGWPRYFIQDINNPAARPTIIDLGDRETREHIEATLDAMTTRVRRMADQAPAPAPPLVETPADGAGRDVHIRAYGAETRMYQMAPLPERIESVPPPPPPPVGMPVIPPPDPRPYPGGEQYTTIEERPFVTAAEQPLSTFSLHPDGAAYANVRRMLQAGQLPPRDAVRIEELVNYFDYDYPQPVGEHPFSVNIEVAACPWAPGHLLAKIGLQGREVDREERPPANLVFLIDTSGSMNRPNRLPLVKESLKALLENLNARDRVGIVTYAGQSLTTLESTPLSQRDRIVSAIDGLHASGSTHGSAGIQDAYAMAQQHFIEGGINRVILATDGDFNVGVTSREGLLALIEEKRKTGVFLTVLGYGMGNLKDGTFELLANKGNGNYAYIDNYTEARRVLVKQLSGTLMTIAKDARIQVEFNPAHVRSYRLLGYENRLMAHRDFHDDAKDAGEIGAGHTVTALYQLVPHGVALDPGVDDLRYQTPEPAPPVEHAGTTELMFVKLRYKQPDSDVSRLIEIPVPVHAVSLDRATADFRFAAAAAGFGLLLRDSAHKGDVTFDLVRRLAAGATDNNHRREELVNLIVTAKTLRGQ